jgi:XTP/dITP diphosphohydrolase
VTLKLLVGTNNSDKAQEIEAIFGSVCELLTGQEHAFAEVEEDQNTLEGNAQKKAAAISKETGLAVLADDTGLEVDALHGAPGVFSARYAGEEASYADNVKKLLADLKGDSKRRAQFRTVCVIHFPDGQEISAIGEISGQITTAPRGRGGFGYDSVFMPDGFSKTFGELPAAIKNKISHRASALRMMKSKLEAHLNP